MRRESLIKSKNFALSRESVCILTAYTLILYLIGALAAMFWTFVLPDKYFYDGNYIRDLLGGTLSVNFDSFVHTALVYKLLGYSDATPREVVAFTVFSLSFLPVIAAFMAGMQHVGYANLALLAALVGISSIYLGQYSKEPIAIWSVSFALYLLGLRRPFAWTAFLPIVLYGLFFRSYWIIVAFFWLLLFWLSYRSWSISVKMLLLLCAMVLVSVIFYLTLGYHITEVRDRVNEYRQESPDAVSMIRNYLPNSSVLHSLANWLVSWLLILIPLPMLTLFGLQYAGLFALYTYTLYFLLLSKKKLDFLKLRLLPSKRRRLQGSFTFMLAFTLVQATFEPDYGSVLKHMMDLLPMIAFVLGFGTWKAKGTQ